MPIHLPLFNSKILASLILLQRSDSEYEFNTHISVDLNDKYIRKTKTTTQSRFKSLSTWHWLRGFRKRCTANESSYFSKRLSAVCLETMDIYHTIFQLERSILKIMLSFCTSFVLLISLLTALPYCKALLRGGKNEWLSPFWASGNVILLSASASPLSKVWPTASSRILCLFFFD